MKKYLLIFALITIWSCKKDPENLVGHLDGYWEIKEVVMPDGTTKEYTFNNTIDFLSVNSDRTGFRKKLVPNIDGSFSTSNDEEHFKIVIEKKRLYLYYETPYSKWKEIVLEASEDYLVTENPDGIRYVYKRYEPLNLN